MEIVAKGTIAGVDWHLQRADESPGVATAGVGALFFMKLRRPGHAWTNPEPFDDTVVPAGEWDAVVEREARRRVAELLRLADTSANDEVGAS